jgi:hypothetical protein
LRGALLALEASRHRRAAARLHAAIGRAADAGIDVAGLAAATDLPVDLVERVLRDRRR